MHYQRQIAFHNKAFKSFVEKSMGLPFPLGYHETIFDIKKINALNFVKEKGELAEKDTLIVNSRLSTEQKLEDANLIPKINKFIEDFLITKGAHSYMNPSIKLTLSKSLALDLPVYLVQMPEVLLRMVAAVEFRLEQLKGMLEIGLKYYKKDKSIPLGELISRKYPEVHYKLKSIYMNALIRDLTYAHKERFLIIMEHPYVQSLRKELNEPLQSKLAKYKDLLMLPMKNEEEPNEELVEKHAMLDAIYGTKLWKEQYIDHALIFLDYNKKAFTDKEYNEYKRAYAQHYKNYANLIKSL
eukprot:TRINITY_DN12749_c0_g1_i8.p1 TRINITY_DN12749_c0_g1~~TRINITY_DN12749_c0_g1_i8.p1  ORF type:complete len:298 (+),score=86.13 TRINITY_DN12749_c0_g1_i8:369-1262(+)